jgi:hypothetical protein
MDSIKTNLSKKLSDIGHNQLTIVLSSQVHIMSNYKLTNQSY